MKLNEIRNKRNKKKWMDRDINIRSDFQVLGTSNRGQIFKRAPLQFSQLHKVQCFQSVQQRSWWRFWADFSRAQHAIYWALLKSGNVSSFENLIHIVLTWWDLTYKALQTSGLIFLPLLIPRKLQHIIFSFSLWNPTLHCYKDEKISWGGMFLQTVCFPLLEVAE